MRPWLDTIKTHLPLQTHRLIVSCILGIAAGLVAVAFHLGIEFLFHATIKHFAETPDPASFALKSFLAVMGTGLAASLILYRSGTGSAAAGSGIAQVKLAFWKEFGFIPFRVVITKFFAGVLSIGGGLSLGREGPTVQIASGLASGLSSKFGFAKQARRGACAAGAASGLAAAFNTPLAAITFVLEEIVGDLNSQHLGGVLLAAVMGAITVHLCLGDQPAFGLVINSISWGTYVGTVFVAFLAGVLGIAFHKLTLKLRITFRNLKLSPVLKPLVGSFVTWGFGVLVFTQTGLLGVFGLGYEDLTNTLRGELASDAVVFLLVTKFICVVFAYSSGGCGGIFAPLLFLGGMCGYASAGVLDLVIPLEPDDYTALATVGMCACFGTVVRAPITAILMLFEMTHQFLLLPPLMLATLVSQVLGLTQLKHNFYDELLLQDGHDLHRVLPPRDLKQWQQRPVASIASFNPISIEESDLDKLADFLSRHPQRNFPVVKGNIVTGVLTRVEANEAIQENRIPEIIPPTTVTPDETLGEIQLRLIDSKCDMVIVVEGQSNRLLGLLTLKDILRHQMAHADQ